MEVIQSWICHWYSLATVLYPFLSHFPMEITHDQHPQCRIPRMLLGGLVFIPSHHPMCYIFQMLNPMRLMMQQ